MQTVVSRLKITFRAAQGVDVDFKIMPHGRFAYRHQGLDKVLGDRICTRLSKIMDSGAYVAVGWQGMDHGARYARLQEIGNQTGNFEEFATAIGA